MTTKKLIATAGKLSRRVRRDIGEVWKEKVEMERILARAERLVPLKARTSYK